MLRNKQLALKFCFKENNSLHLGAHLIFLFLTSDTDLVALIRNAVSSGTTNELDEIYVQIILRSEKQLQLTDREVIKKVSMC